MALPSRSPIAGLFHGLVVVVTSLYAASCIPANPEPARPNILLITIDTLRADHLGAYGYPIDTTPNIDALAKLGTVVERCVSSAPETAPGTATLLTGLYQHEHAVTHNRRILPDDVTTLAEHLAAAGYATAGFVGNFLVGPKFGFDQGFDVMETFSPEFPILPRDPLGTAAATAWLTERADAEDDAPWFVWVHYLDPHGPYTPTKTAWSDSIVYDPEMFVGDAEPERSDSNFGLGVIPKYQALPNLTKLSQYVRFYDTEIRATDAQIGKLVDIARHVGGVDSTLIVLTADHGESLLEHREYLQHGWYLYDTTVRIPLVVSLPGRIPAGSRLTTQTAGVDLMPTILDLAGLEADGPPLHGRSIAAALVSDSRMANEPAFVYGPRENHPFAISMDGYKLIHTPAGAPAAANEERDPATPERYELYSVDDDPGETKELGPEHPRFDELRERLTVFETRFRQRLWERGHELKRVRKAGQAAAK